MSYLNKPSKSKASKYKKLPTLNINQAIQLQHELNNNSELLESNQSIMEQKIIHTMKNMQRQKTLKSINKIKLKGDDSSIYFINTESNRSYQNLNTSVATQQSTINVVTEEKSSAIDSGRRNASKGHSSLITYVTKEQNLQQVLFLEELSKNVSICSTKYSTNQEKNNQNLNYYDKFKNNTKNYKMNLSQLPTNSVKQEKKQNEKYRKVHIFYDDVIYPMKFTQTEYQIKKKKSDFQISQGIDPFIKSKYSDRQHSQKDLIFEKLLHHCQQTFQTKALRYLFLLNEQPINYLFEIPENCNILIISNNPFIAYWKNIFNAYKIKDDVYKRQTMFNKINNFSNSVEIINFLKIQENFNGTIDVENPFQDLVGMKPVIQTQAKELNIDKYEQLKPKQSNQMSIFQKWNDAAGDGEQFFEYSDKYENKKILPNEMQELLENNRTEEFVDSQYFPTVQKKKISEIKIKKNQPQQINTEGKKILDNCTIQIPQYNYPDELVPRIIDQKEYAKADNTFVNRNLHKFDELQSGINKEYPSLFNQNIPQILKKTSFSRSQLHQLYAKYKCLIHFRSDLKNSNKRKQSLKDGISLKIIKKGFDVLLTTPVETMGQMLKSSYDIISLDDQLFDWKEFISILDLIESKNQESKIDMIIQLLDIDSLGEITFDQIVKEGCHLLSSMFCVKDIEGELLTVVVLAETIARSVYTALNYDISKTIKTVDLKMQLLKKNKDLDLLLILFLYNLNEEVEEDSDKETDAKVIIQQRINKKYKAMKKELAEEKGDKEYYDLIQQNE